jgi:hypothetical protein
MTSTIMNGLDDLLADLNDCICELQEEEDMQARIEERWEKQRSPRSLTSPSYPMHYNPLPNFPSPEIPLPSIPSSSRHRGPPPPIITMARKSSLPPFQSNLSPISPNRSSSSSLTNYRHSVASTLPPDSITGYISIATHNIFKIRTLSMKFLVLTDQKIYFFKCSRDMYEKERYESCIPITAESKVWVTEDGVYSISFSSTGQHGILGFPSNNLESQRKSNASASSGTHEFQCAVCFFNLLIKLGRS